MVNTQFRGYPRVGPNNVTSPDGGVQLNTALDAIDADVQVLSTGYRLAAVLNYTSSGSFTKGAYANIKAVEVEVIGGGGGSGFAAATSGGQISWGCGGAGGGYSHGFILASALASSETVTVGAAGTAGSSGTPNGGNGGASAFGLFATANGGQGGDANLQSTGASGTAVRDSGGTAAGTSADITIPGEGDGAVTFTTGILEDITGLQGARSGGPYGATNHNTFGVATGSSSSQGNSPGLGIGSGARGPVRITSSSSTNGAAGSAGRVIVRVYV